MTTATMVRYVTEAPEVFELLEEVENVIATFDLDPGLHHMVKLRASQMNRCAYCVKMHTTEARRNVGRPAVRHHTPPARQRELLDAFRNAIHERATDAFARLLADDVALTADGGGRVAAVLETLAGPVDVLEFVGSRLAEYWGELKLVDSELNAGAGLEIWDHGELSATVSFDLDDSGLIRYIFIVRNPDKLERLANTPDVVA
jgi:AhpD family alkylhydroperoxidase